MLGDDAFEAVFASCPEELFPGRLESLAEANGCLLISDQLLEEMSAHPQLGERLTGALLDRITHHVNILEMNGDSYRLAQSRARKPG